MDYSCQVSLSVGFPRREHWSGLPFPSSGDLPDPGIEPPGLLHCRQILYCLSQGHVQKERNHPGLRRPSHTWSTIIVYSLCWTGHLDTLMQTTGHTPSLPGNKPYSQVSPSGVCLTRFFSFPSCPLDPRMLPTQALQSMTTVAVGKSLQLSHATWRSGSRNIK